MSLLAAILPLVVALPTPALAEEEYGNLLECPVIDMTQGAQAGQSFLSLIQNTVKPELDAFATEGYPIAGGDRLVDVLEAVDAKVARQVMRSLKGKHRKEKLANLKAIGDKLEGQTATLYTLPGKVSSTRLAKDRYKLSTYIGLASCGGSSMKLADDNYAYNVHYGTGSERKDKQTGRSFGASRIYNATDSSYSHYLGTLERYALKTPRNMKHFVSTIMETLTNSEPRRYDRVNDYGDAVLTDFFAIWTAEQTRNIMDGRVDLHWDAALLQVTLLAAFHAGQDELKLFYKDPLTGKRYFTGTTYELAWPRKNHAEETCDVNLESREYKPASLKDYIGVHYRMYEHCGRSGINMSRREWKLLSKEITAFLMATPEGKAKVERVRKYLGRVIDLTKNERGKRYRERDKDILREIARYLINRKAPQEYKDWYRVSQAVTALMVHIQKNANTITEAIEAKYDEAIYPE